MKNFKLWLNMFYWQLFFGLDPWFLEGDQALSMLIFFPFKRLDLRILERSKIYVQHSDQKILVVYVASIG